MIYVEAVACICRSSKGRKEGNELNFMHVCGLLVGEIDSPR